MPSPFPGMNPYLEKAAKWPDFHETFLVNFRVALVPQITPRYSIEFEVSLYLDPSDDDRLFGIADAALIPERTGPGGGAATLAAPVTVRVPGVTKKKASRLLVRDTDSLEIVTVVELLSPSNKDTGPDRTRHIDKRTTTLTSRVNLVELDFLRGGPRLPVRTLPPCAYYALVSRHWERPDMGLWPIGLRDPLPTIPVPLREGEGEPRIDLQGVLNQAYDGAGYATHIYRTPPEPQLPPDDAAWARDILTTAGIRS